MMKRSDVLTSVSWLLVVLLPWRLVASTSSGEAHVPLPQHSASVNHEEGATLATLLAEMTQLRERVARLENKLELKSHQISALAEQVTTTSALQDYNTADISIQKKRIEDMESFVSDLHKKLTNNNHDGQDSQRHRQLTESLEEVIAKTACISDLSDDTKMWFNPECLYNIDLHDEYACIPDQAAAYEAVDNVDAAIMEYGPIHDWCFEEMSMEKLFSSDRSDSMSSFNQDIGGWNVSKVTNMSQMFRGAKSFNQFIGNWDVSKVTDMSYLFYYDTYSSDYEFNQDIGAWNVSQVTNMGSMFGNARSFNQDIGNWDVSRVENMTEFMYSASSFNQDISNWDTSKVTDMNTMFLWAAGFNQNISGWDTGNVSDMAYMFATASSFNQNLSNWDVGKVTNMAYTFYGATLFNGDIGSWSVGKVTDTTSMFQVANKFNQDLSSWDMGQVQSTIQMFYSADSFDQDLCGWQASLALDVSKDNMFVGSSCEYSKANEKYGVWFKLCHKCDVPSEAPSVIPTMAPSVSSSPTSTPSEEPSSVPTNTRSEQPSTIPSHSPSDQPTAIPSHSPSVRPSITPSASPPCFADRPTVELALQDILTSGSSDYYESVYGPASHWCFEAMNFRNLLSTNRIDYAVISTFNQDISNWDVSKITNMAYMFRGATHFDQDLSGWDVRQVTNMIRMFKHADQFNGNIASWDVSQVTDMKEMFNNATAFNQPIGGWDVSLVTDMSSMFSNASAFNQDLSGWDVGLVTSADEMFYRATAFANDLCAWGSTLPLTTSVHNMFQETACIASDPTPFSLGGTWEALCYVCEPCSTGLRSGDLCCDSGCNACGGDSCEKDCCADDIYNTGEICSSWDDDFCIVQTSA